MLQLYYAPRTRAVRIVQLLEELGLPYQLERVEFAPSASDWFVQKTPLGKLPALEDGDVVMCESGAITEYRRDRDQAHAHSGPVSAARRADRGCSCARGQPPSTFWSESSARRPGC